MKPFVVFIFLLSTVFLLSCGISFFPKKEMVITKETGILVFIDDSLRRYRNQSGDVFTDSLLPDFFIPFNFTKKPVSETYIRNALFVKPKINVSFIHISGDCNGVSRKSSIEESATIFLNKYIDTYSSTKKLYLLPTEIYFLNSSANSDYLNVHTSITIYDNNDSVRISMKKGYLDILRMSVVEYEWPSVYK